MTDDLTARLRRLADPSDLPAHLSRKPTQAERDVLKVAIALAPVAKEAADALDAKDAEIERLRAALAQSDQPCAYCSLPAEEWAKCQHGFPGCARADDAMGCPHLGASLEVERLNAQVAVLREALGVIANTGQDGTLDQVAPEMWAGCRETARAALSDTDDRASALQAEGWRFDPAPVHHCTTRKGD